MANSRICQHCNQADATAFATFTVRGQSIKAALCESCSHTAQPQDILDRRIAQLTEPLKAESKPQKKRIFVVVEIEKRDDYYANQPLQTPVAAFIRQANASTFI